MLTFGCCCYVPAFVFSCYYLNGLLSDVLICLLAWLGFACGLFVAIWVVWVDCLQLDGFHCGLWVLRFSWF